jgi:hypothetical protein
MAEHAEHSQMGHVKGPANTLPMMMGEGPYRNLEMGRMFTVVKVRHDLARGNFHDPVGTTRLPVRRRTSLAESPVWRDPNKTKVGVNTRANIRRGFEEPSMKSYLSLLAILLFAGAGVAHAHAHLEKSQPARNSTVSVLPKNVVLEFNEAVQMTALTLQAGNAKAQDLGPLNYEAAELDEHRKLVA